MASNGQLWLVMKSNGLDYNFSEAWDHLWSFRTQGGVSNMDFWFWPPLAKKWPIPANLNIWRQKFFRFLRKVDVCEEFLTKHDSLRCTVIEIWAPHEKAVTGNYRLPVTRKFLIFGFSEPLWPKDDRKPSFCLDTKPNASHIEHVSQYTPF